MQTTEKKPDEKKPVQEKVSSPNDVAAPGTLWTIEIVFDHDHEVKRHKIINFSNAHLKQFRDNIFVAGFMYPVDPGHYILVSPYRLRQIDVYKQDRRFKEF